MSLLSSYLTIAINSLKDFEPGLTKTRLELERPKKCEAELQADVIALRGYMHEVCSLICLPNTWVTRFNSMNAKCEWQSRRV
jgi:hypothetical protein